MNAQKRINWVDGMLINKTHFKGMEDYLLSKLHTSVQLLSSGGYGIINYLNDETEYPLIRISVDSSDSRNQKIIVEQMEFYAVTPSGTLMDISNENFFAQKTSKEVSKSQVVVNVEEQKISHGDPLYLVLLIQPFETVGIGFTGDNEEPLRLPFCCPVAELKCVSCNSDTENIVGPNHFPIAKIKIINHRLEIDRNYIPPCFSVSAHHRLKNKSLALIDGMLKISNNIDAFMQGNQGASEQNTKFIREVYFVLYPKLIEYTEFLRDEDDIKPREIFRIIRVIALQFKKLLLCNSDAYAFFTESWNSKYGINFHSFSTETDCLNNIKYYDIVETVESCEKILAGYLIKITEIKSYSLSGYQPRMPQEFIEPPEPESFDIELK